ncbi:MAG: LysM peptidoglycan-binding domain-containing protein [Rikenellaceae bacterium]
MKRFIVTILGVAVLAATGGSIVVGAPKDRTESVVYIDGARYYIHRVEAGETLYSLAKEYGVSTSDIYDVNPIIRNGFNEGINIKIPYVVEAVKAVSDKKLSKVFDLHRVKRGDTLYAIARQYEISVDMILEDNPTLDPSSLAIGQSINIRKSEQGQSSQSATMSELDEYRQQLNRVVDDGLVYHLVDEYDTLESLQDRFDMREGEIEDLNDLPMGKPIPVGTLILVNDMSDYEDGQLSFARASFEPLQSDEPLVVSLLLPLSIRGYAMKPIVEFYQGFLMGVEELKQSGRSVVVNLFNTERSSETVETIVASEEFQNSDLIVGPVYEELMPLVLSDAERRRIPVVSPLASLSNSDSEVLFQVAPVVEVRYNKLSELLDDEERVITVIYGENNDMSYVAQIDTLLAHHGLYVQRVDTLPKQYELLTSADSLLAQYGLYLPRVDSLLSAEVETVELQEASEESESVLFDVEAIDTLPEQCGREFLIHKYKYEHPSVITERERAFAELLKRAKAEIDTLGYEVDSVAFSQLACETSPSDLTPLICNGAKSNIFFVVSDSETEVDRILSALASAYTTQVSERVDSGEVMSEVLNFSVVANPAWRSYDNIDKTLYFRNRVVNFPSYMAGRDADVVREFDSRYSEEFSDFPSLYSYRGYDVVKMFGEGMYNDIQYGMSSKIYTPLQTQYRFERVDSLQRRVNTNWMKVRYNLDFTLTVE